MTPPSKGADAPAKAVKSYTLDDIRGALAAGNVILATRAFPFPHRYWLAADEAAAEAGDYKVEHEVSEAKVQRLVAAEHVRARMLDRATADRIVYTLTEKGRAAVPQHVQPKERAA